MWDWRVGRGKGHSVFEWRLIIFYFPFPADRSIGSVRRHYWSVSMDSSWEVGKADLSGRARDVDWRNDAEVAV